MSEYLDGAGQSTLCAVSDDVERQNEQEPRYDALDHHICCEDQRPVPAHQE